MISHFERVATIAGKYGCQSVCTIYRCSKGGLPPLPEEHDAGAPHAACATSSPATQAAYARAEAAIWSSVRPHMAPFRVKIGS